MRLRAHHHLQALAVALVAAAIVTPVERASGQCTPGWDVGLTDGIPDFDGRVRAVTHWDPDGPGPQPEMLVFAGEFQNAGNAANLGFIVGWDGQRWYRFGDGLPAYPLAVSTFRGKIVVSYDEGVVIWDGEHWNQIGAGLVGEVEHLTEFAGNLYAAGFLSSVNGASVSPTVVRWDGEAWSAITELVHGSVADLMPWNGKLLIAGRDFWQTGGFGLGGVITWDGTRLERLGFDAPWNVEHATVYRGEVIVSDDLYLSAVGGVRRWDGAAWTTLGDGLMHGSSNASVTFVRSCGDDLIAIGNFDHSGATPLSGFAAWNGGRWRPVPPVGGVVPTSVEGLKSELVAFGSFEQLEAPGFRFAARGSGDEWRPIGGGPAGSIVGYEVSSIAVQDGNVYIGGTLREAGGLPISGVAEWTSGGWKPLGPGLDAGYPPLSLLCFEGSLIAMGDPLLLADTLEEIGGFARWDGQTWSPLGPAAQAPAAMTVHQGSLYSHCQIGDARGLARWNGSDWILLSEGWDYPSILTSFGEDLIAAGEFDSFGGITAKNIARWDGVAWHPMGTRIVGPGIAAVAVFKGTLFCCGSGLFGPGVDANLAYWDGTEWQPVLVPWYKLNGLFVWNDDLFAYSENGGPLLRWNGSGMDRVDGAQLTWDGQTGMARVAVMVPQGDTLFVGGIFWTAGDDLAAHFARWRDPQPPSITGPAESVITCPGSTSAFAVAATGSQPVTYRWRRDGVDLADGLTATGSTISGATTESLTITNVSPDDAGAYSCAVTNACATVSAPAALVVCLADFDCNGFVNGEDMDAFNAAFDAGDSSADVNRDGFVTGDDFDEFTAHFDTGC